MLLVVLLMFSDSPIFFSMFRLPPRPIRTDTLCPYTTLFLSGCAAESPRSGWLRSRRLHKSVVALHPPAMQQEFRQLLEHDTGVLDRVKHATAVDREPHAYMRPEERRVGKECVSPRNTRWWPYQKKKTHKRTKRDRMQDK